MFHLDIKIEKRVMFEQRWKSQNLCLNATSTKSNYRIAETGDSLCLQ